MTNKSETTILGAFAIVLMGLSSWTLYSVTDMEPRIAVLEEKQLYTDTINRIVLEDRVETKVNLAEILVNQQYIKESLQNRKAVVVLKPSDIIEGQLMENP